MASLTVPEVWIAWISNKISENITDFLLTIILQKSETCRSRPSTWRGYQDTLDQALDFVRGSVDILQSQGSQMNRQVRQTWNVYWGVNVRVAFHSLGTNTPQSPLPWMDNKNTMFCGELLLFFLLTHVHKGMPTYKLVHVSCLPKLATAARKGLRGPVRYVHLQCFLLWVLPQPPQPPPARWEDLHVLLGVAVLSGHEHICLCSEPRYQHSAETGSFTNRVLTSRLIISADIRGLNTNFDILMTCGQWRCPFHVVDSAFHTDCRENGHKEQVPRHKWLLMAWILSTQGAMLTHVKWS